MELFCLLFQLDVLPVIAVKKKDHDVPTGHSAGGHRVRQVQLMVSILFTAVGPAG